LLPTKDDAVIRISADGERKTAEENKSGNVAYEGDSFFFLDNVSPGRRSGGISEMTDLGSK